jgi:tetratricopeptide (TPR) repeat protein
LQGYQTLNGRLSNRRLLLPDGPRLRQDGGPAQKAGDQEGFVAALEKALSCYQQSIERLPILSNSYQNAGLALFRLGRLPEAERILEEGIDVDAQQRRSDWVVGEYLYADRRARESGALLDEAIQKAGRIGKATDRS